MGWLIKSKNSIFDFSCLMKISFPKIIFPHGTIDYVSLSALGERIAGGLHPNPFHDATINVRKFQSGLQ